MSSGFFVRVGLSALQYRKQRLILAFGALAVGAALATVMLGVYASIAARIRDQFRGYGANLVAVSASGGTIPLAMVDAAERMGAQAAPLLVTSGRINNQAVPVAGVVSAKTNPLHSYWHVNGSRTLAPGNCLAGELLATQFSLQLGATVPLEGQPCTLTGIVSTGDAEDQELIVPFEAAAALSGIHDAASMIEIQAPGENIEAVRTALAAQFPADIRTVRAVAGTESIVVLKMRAALFLLTLLILVITTLCVTSNFSEIVIERSKEIGIMKALGGAESRIAAFFVSESAVLAMLATVIGYAVGIFAAAAIGREIFGGVFRVHVDWLVLVGVGSVMFLVATVATAIATARIWSVQPAVILRGE